MSDLPFNRRDLLKLSGVGVIGASTLAQTSAAEETSGGEEVWSFETEGPVVSSPTVVDGTVFLGGDKLYALDATSGNKEWAFEAGGGFRSTPNVNNGIVFAGSWDDNVYAVDAEDGSEEWSFWAGASVRSSPTVANGTVYFGSDDHTVYAVDADDGGELWSFQTGWRIKSSPTVMDGVVFVGSGDESVYALDANDGSKIWSFEDIYYEVNSSPTVVDEIVFIGSNKERGHLNDSVHALNVDDGSEVWSYATDGSVRSSPTVADGTVYVGQDGVYALDADDGGVKWFWESTNVRSSPTVVSGTVFVGSDDHTVYALDAENGGEIWSFDTGGGVRSSPTVVDGKLFIGSYDGKVYALDAGVNGSSEGSRVNLGTLGHHHEWAGQPPSATKIEDWHDLDAIRDDLDGDYVLVNDLDEDTAGYDEHVGDPQQGWDPIGFRENGNDEEYPFSGSFDGDGHAIHGLVIERPEREYVGLFGYTQNATFHSLELLDVSVEGEDYVGALAGWLRSTGSEVESVHITGNIQSKDMAGGVAGLSNGTIFDTSTNVEVVTTKHGRSTGGVVGQNTLGLIEQSVATGIVEAPNKAGGLVGWNTTGNIIESVSTAKVTGEDRIGGLVGEVMISEDGSIERSYALGDVDGISRVGGIVGRAEAQSIEETFAAGMVSGDELVGGFAGVTFGQDPDVENEADSTTEEYDSRNVSHAGGDEQAPISDGYWDTEESEQNDGIGDGDGDVTGLTTAEMQGKSAESNMSTLDFEDTWKSTTEPDGYPVLHWQETNGLPTDPIESALDKYEQAATDLFEGELRAQAHFVADLYDEFGQQYANEVTGYLGYKAGELPPDAVDEDLADLADPMLSEFVGDESLESTPEAVAADLLGFFEELFDTFDESDSLETLRETAEAFFFGDHPDQSNQLLIDGDTPDEIETDMQADFQNQRDTIWSLIADQNPPEGVRDRIAMEIERAAAEFSREADEVVKQAHEEAQLLEGEPDEEVEFELSMPEAEERTLPDLPADLDPDDQSVQPQAVLGGVGIVGAAVFGGKLVGGAGKYGLGKWALGTVSFKGAVAAVITLLKKCVVYLLKKIVLGIKKLISKFKAKLKEQVIKNARRYGRTIVERVLVSQQGILDLQVVDATVEDLTEEDEIEQDRISSFADIWNSIVDLILGRSTVGRKTGFVTVENTGSVPIVPEVDIEAEGRDTVWLPVPGGVRVEYEEVIEPLAAGEQRTIPFTYQYNMDLYSEGRLSIETFDYFLTEEAPFDARVERFDIEGDEGWFSGILSDGFVDRGGSVLTDYTVGAVSDGSQMDRMARIDRDTEPQRSLIEASYEESHLDLHVYDQAGNHVGYDYEEEEIVEEIPGAEHSGRDLGADGSEWVVLTELAEDEYEIELVGPDTQSGGSTEGTLGARSHVTESDELSYSLEVTEEPLQPPEVGSLTSSINLNAEATQTATGMIRVSELNGDQGLEDLSVSISELTHVDGESIIPADNVSVSEEVLSIPAGEQRSLEVDVVAPEEAAIGDYVGTIIIGDGEQQVEVEIDLTIPVSIELVKYADRDGEITTAGVREAISDWQSARITNDLLTEAIDRWSSGNSVF